MNITARLRSMTPTQKIAFSMMVGNTVRLAVVVVEEAIRWKRVREDHALAARTHLADVMQTLDELDAPESIADRIVQYSEEELFEALDAYDDAQAARQVAAEANDARVSLEEAKDWVEASNYRTEQNPYGQLKRTGHRPDCPCGYCTTVRGQDALMDEIASLAIEAGCDHESCREYVARRRSRKTDRAQEGFAGPAQAWAKGILDDAFGTWNSKSASGAPSITVIDMDEASK